MEEKNKKAHECESCIVSSTMNALLRINRNIYETNMRLQYLRGLPPDAKERLLDTSSQQN
jgi:hypothetical protein